MFTGGGDEAAIAKGIFDTYQTSNLRYSQMAPIDMYTERNTGTNLPAEIKVSAIDGDEYKFMFIAKGGGSANKSFLYQETKALLNEATLFHWIFEKIQTLGTSACPPYHLGVVIGGTSAEFAVETAKLATTRYLDALPTMGSASGHGFRDVELLGRGGFGEVYRAKRHSGQVVAIKAAASAAAATKAARRRTGKAMTCASVCASAPAASSASIRACNP